MSPSGLFLWNKRRMRKVESTRKQSKAPHLNHHNNARPASQHSRPMQFDPIGSEPTVFSPSSLHSFYSLSCMHACSHACMHTYRKRAASVVVVALAVVSSADTAFCARARAVDATNSGSAASEYDRTSSRTLLIHVSRTNKEAINHKRKRATAKIDLI